MQRTCTRLARNIAGTALICALAAFTTVRTGYKALFLPPKTAILAAMITAEKQADQMGNSREERRCFSEH